jgi:hypothetical protein
MTITTDILPQPRTLRLREDLFRICGGSYIETFLLETFLSGGFDTPTPAGVETLAKSVFLGPTNHTKVQNSLRRLLDRGYVEIVSVGPTNTHNRNTPRTWVVKRDIINRDIKRLGDYSL